MPRRCWLLVAGSWFLAVMPTGDVRREHHEPQPTATRGDAHRKRDAPQTTSNQEPATAQRVSAQRYRFTISIPV
jgi:hypothetical protein